MLNKPTLLDVSSPHLIRTPAQSSDNVQHPHHQNLSLFHSIERARLARYCPAPSQPNYAELSHLVMVGYRHFQLAQHAFDDSHLQSMQLETRNCDQSMPAQPAALRQCLVQAACKLCHQTQPNRTQCHGNLRCAVSNSKSKELRFSRCCW